VDRVQRERGVERPHPSLPRPPAEDVRPLSRSSPATLRWPSAGTRLTARALAAVIAIVNATTRQSTSFRTQDGGCIAVDAEMNRDTPKAPSARPSAPPAAQTTRVSTSDCRRMWPRRAPSA
jgi:hypothetical protein